MATTQQLIDKFQIIGTNPMAAQRLALDTLDKLTNGEIIIVDPTGPVPYLLEVALSASSAAMLQNEALNRRQYSSVAKNEEELYLHMSDKDYIGRFAAPGKAQAISIALSLDEVISKAVDVNDGNGTRKLTIPKHTEITVADMKFTLQYAIDIWVMSWNGIDVLYDTSTMSPLQRLESNRPSWAGVTIGGRRYLRITFPVMQMAIISNMAQLNNITGFSKQFAFTDNFYCVRAYTKNNVDAAWTEIAVTHTALVYDPTVATVVLKVLNQAVDVKVPQIYFNNGLIKDSIRIDIYTTKGPVDFSLAAYSPTTYKIRWTDRDTEKTSDFSAPFATFSEMIFFSDSQVSGGTLPLTFAQLREQVMNNNRGDGRIPITPSQLTRTAEVNGFGLVLNIDNLTDRQYLATRQLPAPTDGSTVTGAGCTIHQLQAKMADLAMLDTVADNGNRITIKPETLFLATDGVFEPVASSTVATLKNPALTPPEALANLVNSANYYWTPYYYVLDATQEEFNLRPYRLNAPQVVSRFFANDNPSLLFDVSTLSSSLTMSPTGSGYLLQIEILTNEVFRAFALDQIAIQLSYKRPGSTQRFHYNAVLLTPIDGGTNKPVNDRYVYGFYLDTNFDIDAQHRLIMTPGYNEMELSTEFDLVYIIKNHMPPGTQTTDIDSIIDKLSIPNYDQNATYVGIVQEKIALKFGDFLKHLWARSRSVAGSVEYATYVTDVPAIYTENVYLRDSMGNIELSWDSINNELDYTLLRPKGYPVPNTAGEAAYATALESNSSLTYADWWDALSSIDKSAYQELAHRAGDRVRGVDGEYVVTNSGRAMLRQIDLLFIDGKYYFSTADVTTSYVSELIETMSSWIVNEIASIASSLGERTQLFLYPATTVGVLKAIVANGQEVTVSADQHFVVQYYLTDDKYKNVELKRRLAERTPKILADALTADTIALSDIIGKLRDANGNDVVSTSVTGFVGDAYPAITLKDRSLRPTIGKQLVPLSNQLLAVEDAVSVEFINHTKK